MPIHPRRILPVLLALALGAGGVRAETITLVDGVVIDAPILKQTRQAVWVDLGDEVVRLSRDRIATIADGAGAEDRAAPETGRVYRGVASPVERTPEQQARRHGAAVVKIATPVATGSGFITSPEGYVVTNAHVIQGETDVRCIIFAERDGVIERRTIEDVEIIAVNDHFDLALLRMPPQSDGAYPSVSVQLDDELDAGEPVFAIGAPLGLERTLSSGVIATTLRSFEGIPYIQTTTQINPGNSGGPLFNLAGEVIGVTNMKIPFGEGLGFAIPARYVRDFLDNHEAFAYDADNPNSGHTYHRAPERLRFTAPAELDDR